MRANPVLLNSLSVGRCFTLPVEPGPADQQASAGDPLRVAKSVLAAKDAWKIVSLDEEASCLSARGETRAFPLEERVVEIPRQGYDRLAQG